MAAPRPTSLIASACSPRQVQRWEAGEVAMPIGYWQLLRRVWGFRGVPDLQCAEHATRGWGTQRDTERDTIERGDVVELLPKAGPRLRATVSYAEPRDDLYQALVTEFIGPGDVGDEFDGYCLGDPSQPHKPSHAFSLTRTASFSGNAHPHLLAFMRNGKLYEYTV